MNLFSKRKIRKQRREASEGLRKLILMEVEKRHPASDKPLTKILNKLRDD